MFDANTCIVWTVESRTIHAEGKCQDDATLREKVATQYARIDEKLQESILTKSLLLRHLKMEAHSLEAYLTTMAFLDVERQVDRICAIFDNEIDKKNQTIPYRANMTCLDTDSDDVEVAHEELVHYLDVLFFFEREITTNELHMFGCPPSSVGCTVLRREGIYEICCRWCEAFVPVSRQVISIVCPSCNSTNILTVSAISTISEDWKMAVQHTRNSLKRWILRLGAILLQHLRFDDDSYLLQHVKLLPGLATHRSWALSLISIPEFTISPEGESRNAWNEPVFDHFLTLVTILLFPDESTLGFTKHMKVSSSLYSISPSHKSKKISISKQDHHWIVVQDPQIEDDMFLSDEDFAELFKKIPFKFAIDQVYVIYQQNILQACSTLQHLAFTLCQALKKFDQYPKLSNLISNVLITCLNTSFRHCVGRSKSSAEIECHSMSLCFKIVYGHMNTAAESLVPSVPFDKVTQNVAWTLFYSMLVHLLTNHEVLTNPIMRPPSFENWVEYRDTHHDISNQIQDNFQVFTDRNDTIIRSLAALACQRAIGDDIPQVVVYELLNVCSMNAEHHGIVIPAIQSVCISHPICMSIVLNKFHSQRKVISCVPALLLELPFDHWQPDVDDILKLGDLLTSQLNNSYISWSMHVLGSLNWGYKDSKLFNSSIIHRMTCFLILRAHDEYCKANNFVSQLKGWIQSEENFDEWCWKIMMSLKFYDQQDIPLNPLIRLTTDLTSEAAQLRHLSLGEKSIIDVEDDCWNLVSEHSVDIEVDREANLDKHRSYRDCSPLVAYSICLLSSAVLEPSLERWRPLLVLIESGKYDAIAYVLHILVSALASQVPNIDYWKLSDIAGLCDTSKLKFIGELIAYEYVDPGYMEMAKDLLLKERNNELMQYLADRELESRWMHIKVIKSVFFRTHNNSSFMAPFVVWAKGAFDRLRDATLFGQLSGNYLCLHEPRSEGRLKPKLFWMQVIFSIQRWYTFKECLNAISVILENEMLRFQTCRQFGNNSDGLIQCFSILETEYRKKCIKSNMHETFDTKIEFLNIQTRSMLMYNGHCCGEHPTTEFFALLCESRAEWPLYQAFGRLLTANGLKKRNLTHTTSAFSHELSTYGIDASKSQFATLYGHFSFSGIGSCTIGYWANCILELSHEEPCMVLFCQVFFILYFSAYDGQYFGHLILQNTLVGRLKSPSEVVSALRLKFSVLSKHFEKKSLNESNDALILVSTDLSDLYGRMRTWLEAKDPNYWLHERHQNGSGHTEDYYLTSVLSASTLCFESDSIDFSSFWFHLCPSKIVQSEPCDNTIGTSSTSETLDMDISCVVLETPPDDVILGSLSYYPLNSVDEILTSNEVASEFAKHIETSIINREAGQFAESYSKLHCLSIELYECIGDMYICQKRTKNISRGCSLGGKCSGQAKIKFNYSTWTLCSDIPDRLTTIFTQMERLYSENELTTLVISNVTASSAQGGISVSTCQSKMFKSLRLLRDVSTKLVELYKISHEQDRVKWFSVATDWYEFLLHMENQTLRGYPPAKLVLWDTIKLLGKEFVSQNSDKMDTALSCALSDPGRLALFCNFLSFNDSSKILPYATRIVSTKNSLTDHSRRILLKKIDVVKWLDSATEFEVKSFISIIRSEISRRYCLKILTQKECDVADELLPVFCAFLNEIGRRCIATHVVDITQLLLGSDNLTQFSDSSDEETTNGSAMSWIACHEFWDQILDIPFQSWNGMSDIAMTNAVSELGTIIRRSKQVPRSASEEGPILHWHMNGVLESMLKFAENLIAFGPVRNAWLHFENVFMQLLRIDYVPGSMLEPSRTIYMWDAKQCWLGNIVLASMERAIYSIVKRGENVDFIVLKLVYFMTDIAYSGAFDHVLEYFISVVSKLPLNSYCLNFESLQSFLSVLREAIGGHASIPTSSASSFVRQLIQIILVRISWKSEFYYNQFLECPHQRRDYAGSLSQLVVLLAMHGSSGDVQSLEVWVHEASYIPWHYSHPDSMQEACQLIYSSVLTMGLQDSDCLHRITLVEYLIRRELPPLESTRDHRRTELGTDTFVEGKDRDTKNELSKFRIIFTLYHNLFSLIGPLSEASTDAKALHIELATSLYYTLDLLISKSQHFANVLGVGTLIETYQEILSMAEFATISTACLIASYELEWISVGDFVHMQENHKSALSVILFKFVAVAFVEKDIFIAISGMAVLRNMAMFFEARIYRDCKYNNSTFQHFANSVVFPELAMQDFQDCCIQNRCIMVLLVLLHQLCPTAVWNISDCAEGPIKWLSHLHANSIDEAAYLTLCLHFVRIAVGANGKRLLKRRCLKQVCVLYDIQTLC